MENAIAPVRTEPEVDPFRELRELVEAVKADCLIDPLTYLDQIRVTGGAE